VFQQRNKRPSRRNPAIRKADRCRKKERNRIASLTGTRPRTRIDFRAGAKGFVTLDVQLGSMTHLIKCRPADVRATLRQFAQPWPTARRERKHTKGGRTSWRRSVELYARSAPARSPLLLSGGNACRAQASASYTTNPGETPVQARKQSAQTRKPPRQTEVLTAGRGSSRPGLCTRAGGGSLLRRSTLVTFKHDECGESRYQYLRITSQDEAPDRFEELLVIKNLGDTPE